MHLAVLLSSYYYQLLSLAKSFLHKSRNVGQAIKESPHRNGAVSVWKETELSINAPTASHICSCHRFTNCRNCVEHSSLHGSEGQVGASAFGEVLLAGNKTCN